QSALLKMTVLRTLQTEQALECQWGTLESVQNISDLPLQWTAGKKTCEAGEGCQDTLMIMENGPQVYLVLTKGCTTAEDQETSVTEHRVGPGLSIVSYTRVCRVGDFCNGLSSTVPLWAPPPATVPGTLRCPICFARGVCPEDTPEQICPAGHTHCYNGVLKFRGGEITSNLRVQGCMPQPGCNLLNGTQKIGVMDVSENCNLKADAVSCYRGILLMFGSSLAQDPIEWTAHGQQTCDAGEVCQETLLLIDVGYKSLIVGSKGCSRVGQKNSQAVSVHSRPPGMLVASYTRFCSSDFCNSASSSSELLTSLPRPAAPAPGDMQCLACVQFSGSCFQSSRLVTCPKGTTHCYNGDINLNGGGFSATLSIQGCMTQASRSLLNNAQTLGIFSVKETFEQKTESVLPSSDAPGPSLAWAVGLGLPLALWCGGLCPP
uniref:UPAR/Ly6 domain-containing protein n=1 Tax=Castor canadensis TaxID=51338 RepID=A0A8C0X4E9_CASCN